MKSFLGNILGIFSKSWWVEVSTAQPRVIYYFGPFDSEIEAETHKAGYIQDLEQEGAQGIRVAMQRRDRPEQLTIDATEDTTINLGSPLGIQA